MDQFESIYGINGEFTFKVKCKLCEAIIDSGLCNIGLHIIKCPEMEVGLIDYIGGTCRIVKRKDIPQKGKSSVGSDPE